MTGLTAALVAAQLIGPAYQFGDELLSPSRPGGALAAFEQVCVRPFPDRAGFEAAIAAAPGFSRVDAGEAATLARGRLVDAVGGVWASRKLNARYIAAGALAPAQPQPECMISARLDRAPDPAALARRVAGRLRLGTPETAAVGAGVRSRWTLARPGARPARIALATQHGAQGDYLRLTIFSPSEVQ